MTQLQPLQSKVATLNSLDQLPWKYFHLSNSLIQTRYSLGLWGQSSSSQGKKVHTRFQFNILSFLFRLLFLSQQCQVTIGQSISSSSSTSSPYFSVKINSIDSKSKKINELVFWRIQIYFLFHFFSCWVNKGK